MENTLTKPTVDRPIYWRWIAGNTNSIYVEPFPYEEATIYSLTYWKKPTDPKWAYVVVQEKALYNANLTTNFELHSSEEEALVTRILQKNSSFKLDVIFTKFYREIGAFWPLFFLALC